MKKSTKTKKIFVNLAEFKIVFQIRNLSIYKYLRIYFKHFLSEKFSDVDARIVIQINAAIFKNRPQPPRQNGWKPKKIEWVKFSLKENKKYFYIRDDSTFAKLRKDGKINYIFPKNPSSKAHLIGFIKIILSNILLTKNGFLIHAAAVLLKGRKESVLFCGPSESGKTTISGIFNSLNYRVISDETIIIKKIKNNYHCYGTPFIGTGGYQQKNKAIVKLICFLKKRRCTRLVKSSPGEGLIKIFENVIMEPLGDKQLRKILRIIAGLLKTKRPYFLSFNHKKIMNLEKILFKIL